MSECPEIKSWGSGEVETVEKSVTMDNYWRKIVAEYQLGVAQYERIERQLEAMLGSVRAIGMTPAPEYGYDPLPLIRAGEKTHTLRGKARILGTVNQVSLNGTRIPLWIRWVARERVLFNDVNNIHFATTDGIRPDDISPAVAMRRLFCDFRGRKPENDDQMWLLHFEIFADLMDELDGEWEIR